MTKIAMRKSCVTCRLPPHLDDAFNELPISKSAGVTIAIQNAAENPELLVKALRFRLTQPKYDAQGRKTSFSIDVRVEDLLKKLADMSKLPAEQIIRLTMEAYINKL